MRPTKGPLVLVLAQVMQKSLLAEWFPGELCPQSPMGAGDVRGLDLTRGSALSPRFQAEVTLLEPIFTPLAVP